MCDAATDSTLCVFCEDGELCPIDKRNAEPLPPITRVPPRQREPLPDLPVATDEEAYEMDDEPRGKWADVIKQCAALAVGGVAEFTADPGVPLATFINRLGGSLRLNKRTLHHKWKVQKIETGAFVTKGNKHDAIKQFIEKQKEPEVEAVRKKPAPMSLPKVIKPSKGAVYELEALREKLEADRAAIDHRIASVEQVIKMFDGTEA